MAMNTQFRLPVWNSQSHLSISWKIKKKKKKSQFLCQCQFVSSKKVQPQEKGGEVQSECSPVITASMVAQLD